jgi:hypothetical protein
MYGTYGDCSKILRNAYFYSANVSTVANCFLNKALTKRLDIYVPANSTTLNTCLSTSSTKSLIGKSISWGKGGNVYSNIQYKIYIYPVENVAAAREANGD